MRKNGQKSEIKRAIAILLLVTMLPFADFAGCFESEVYGAEIPSEAGNETVTEMVSANDADMQQGLPQAQTLQEEVQTMEIAESITLTEDWNVTEEIVMTGGTLNLNGYTMTVSSNLIHSGGTINLNGGKLVVEGDYRKQTRIQNEDGSYSYEGTDSILQMFQDEDYFLIKGDFYDDSVNLYGVSLIRGCLELQGSFYQSDEAEKWSYGDKNLFLLSGEEKQVIHFKESEENLSRIGKLQITNVSEEGVVIEGKPEVYNTFESDRESHIEGSIYCTGYEFIDGGYYGGDLEILYGIFAYDNFEVGGDLYISSYFYQYADWTVGGNLYISESVYLYADLNVEGDIYITDARYSAGHLYVYEGNLLAKGNVTVTSAKASNSAGIEIRRNESYVLIEGDYNINSVTEYYAYFNWGIMEVRGNITSDQNISFCDGATLILSGEQEQQVHVTEKSRFDYIEIQNDSEEGVSFESYINYEKLTTNGCHVTYMETPVISGYVLNENTVIEGDVVLTGESMDLNGYTLTVKGNLIQKGVVMSVNGGKLIVEGDYSIGEPETMWDEELTIYSVGSLRMTKAEDYVLVYGDCYIARGCSGSTYCGRIHPYCASVLVDGILEVKGDLVARDKDSNSSGSFLCRGNHTLVLSGSTGQKVWLESDNSNMNNLIITNDSEAGVEFIEETVVFGVIDAGRDVQIKGLLRVENIDRIKDGYYPGSVIIEGVCSQDLEIGGDLVIKSELNLEQATLTVNGNVEIEENAKNVDGAMLLMQDEGAYLLVKGDFINKSSLTKLEQGTLEIKGNFTDNCAISYGNEHRVLFSGEQLQTIVSKASLGIVELQNPVGVFSERAFGFYKLILNGCRLIISDEEGVIGYTLNDDYVVEGDLYLVAGVMDLNGHTLTVKGDLILQEGTVNINHGCLVVEGDYRQQFRNRTDDGFTYTESAGLLCMSQEDDILQIEGDMYLMPSDNESMGMENGTVILSGEKKQTITAKEPFTIPGLQVTNTSAEGVVFDTEVTITGVLSDKNAKIKGNKRISITDLNNLENGYFGGDLNLAESCMLQQDLDIKGTLSIDESGNDISLYCGSQEIKVGNLKVAENLYMQDADSHILVNGNLEFKSGACLVFQQGTLEVKGNYTDKSNGDYDIGHRVLLSGNCQQIVDTNAYLGTLELQNHSEEGVYSATTIYKKRLIDNGCRLTIGDGSGIYGYTLTEDCVIDGDLKLLDDTMDLNGHTLTIKGNLILNEGDLRVNGGTLIVEGNLETYAWSRTAYGGNACGSLIMENDGDLVKIAGDWRMEHRVACDCMLDAGIIELQGNIITSGYYDYEYDIYCNLVLNGTEKQTISVYGLQVKNLVIKNNSEDGVYLERMLTVTDSIDDENKKLRGSISIADFSILDHGYFGGSVTLKEDVTLTADVTIAGTLNIYGSLYCGKNTLQVGRLNLYGSLYTEHGSVVANWDMYITSNGILYMEEADAYVLVKGNFESKGYYYQIRSVDNVLTNGVLEIKGNYTDTDSAVYGKDHKIIMSGTALQKISTNSKLGILELKNYSQEGIESDKAIDADKVIMNGCVLKIAYSNAIYGSTLTDDYIAAGNLTLYGGTLDLNGKTMIVKGDLTLAGGELFVNGGTLIVEGSLKMAKTVYYSYNQSYFTYGYGCLIMTNANDKVTIGGNWIIRPGAPCECEIEAGTIELKGNLDKYACEDNSSYNIGCNLILNGTTKQKIYVDDLTQIANLTLNNQSEDGIEFSSRVSVTGEVYQQAGSAGGTGGIVVQDLSQLKNGTYSGKVILEGNSTLSQDIVIEGTLQIDGELHCGGYMLQADTLTVNGKLVMTDEDDYVLVKDKFNFNSTVSHEGYLTNGVLEIMGDISVAKSCRGFVANGEHYTIFRRRNVVDETTVIQRIFMGNYSNIHFAKLELTKDFQTGYANSYSSLAAMADQVIYVRKGESIPAPVEGITVQQITEKSVTLSFEGPWESESLRGFMIYRDGVRIATTSSMTWQDKNLEPDKTYTYEIYPYNRDYQIARTSPEYTVTTLADTQAPAAPENLSVKTRTGSAVTMVWDEATDNVAVAGYRLYRDGVLVYEGAENTYKDTGLEQNTLYTYQVKAFDTSGNESEPGEKVDGVVYMPRIESITPADYEDIGGESVRIHVRCKNDGHSLNSTLTIEYYDAAHERYVMLTNVPVGQPNTTKDYTLSYDWAVSQYALEGDVDLRFILTDTDGNKTEKIVTYVIDKTAPAIPQSIQAQDEGGNVIISWEISRSADCAGYRLYRVNADTNEGVMLADVSGRNSSWYSDSTVEDNTSYHYYVRAYDQFDNVSPMSEIAKVVTGVDTQAPRVTAMEPSSGRISRITDLTITGKDNRGVTTFSLFIRRNSDETWEPLATVEASDNKAVYAWDTTAYEEGNYYIKAVAEDANGNESTDLFMRRYEVDNTGIAKIRLLPATAGSTTIQLEWEDVTEADFGWFVVEENIGGTWKEIATVTNVLGYRAENLKPETTHTYRVTGYDNLGNGGKPSDPVSVTTINDTTPPSISAIEPVSSYYKDSIPLAMKVKDNAGVDHGVFSYSVSGNGFEEIATVSGNGGTSERLSYTWDISDLPAGEITVRFEAYDTAGIHNALYEDAQIENTYIIDRMAPGKVTGVEVTGDEGCISLEWDSVSDNDVASYVIERAEENEPVFRKIGTTKNTLYYTDTDVKTGSTYIYRIAAVDIAGNIGELSDEIYATVRKDEKAPVVTGISPSGEIVGSQPTLKVLAMDNAGLASITVEYRNADEMDIWHEIGTVEASGRNHYQEFTWDTDGLSEENVYEVRAKAKDAAGNVSEYVTRSYQLDLTAPETPELTVKSGSFCIEMNYTENAEEDFRCYKIYRKAYGEKDYTCIQATIQNSFTDAVPETDTTYYYKVRAYDIYGNYSESAVCHSYANHVDKIAPVAELPENVFGFTGMEVAFDGTLCSDNVRINRYEWDFGDGTKQTGVRPVHTYEKAGSYNVMLTVWDGAGNQAYAASIVQIMDKTNSGSATIKVLAKDGTALGGAYVYVKTGNDNDDYVQLRTDVNGEAKVVSKAGIYEFAAYAQDYLPGDGTVRISNYETLEETITLEKGEVITGNLTVERMELDELIEKGVDLSAPENYNTYKFSVELWFAASPLPTIFDLTYSDELLYRPGNTGCIYGASRISNGNGTVYAGLLRPETDQVQYAAGYAPAITYLQTTQSVSWLKDMYDVQLGIINNADSGYTVTNASATLNLPEGMSLASTKSGQTLTTKLPDIEGQESASASWVVRGDQTGTYDLSASFHGVLQPFAADIDAQFEAQMECEVKGGEGIVIYVYPEDTYYPGCDYYIQFRIVNESDRNFYNFTTSLGEYKTSSRSQTVYVKDFDTGELIDIKNSAGMTYQSKAAAKSPTLPVLYDGDLIEVGVFSPGQTIYGTYCQQMGDRYSSTNCFVLIDHLVTTLEGSNSGVKVVVSGISSHISKYVIFTNYRARMREAKEAMEAAETYGDPIDVTTGAFLQDLETISLTGGSDLSFDLHYNSMLADYKGEAGYGWSHDYEQHVTEAGSSLILTLSPYSETSFIHEEAANHTVYGVLQENTVIMADHVYEEGTYLPASATMEGWYMEKDADGYRLVTKEGAVYTFDTEGKMCHISTREGKGTTIRQEENAMTITDDITGESLHILYDENHMINSVTDDHGRTVSLEYSDGDLTAITGVTGTTSTYLYDGCHRMTGAVNANGINYVDNTYDEFGRVLTQKEVGKAGVSRLTYTDLESGGVQVDICNQNGGITSIVTDENGNKIKESGSDGAYTEYLYDKYGNLLDETDAYGNTVMYQYDEDQNLTATYDTAGNVSFIDYDEAGNVTAVRTQTGDESLYTYDANNRLIRNVSPLGEVTRYAYDEDGNAIREIKDGLGISSYTYENGRMTGKTDAEGNQTYCTYDVYGNVASETDAQGNTVDYTYDLAGRVLKAAASDGTVVAYTYDAIGQTIKETVTAKDGQTRTTSYTYDAAGNVTSVKDAAGRKTEYHYDSLSNVTEVIYPDGTSESYTYDAVSNLISQTDRNGIRTSYTYDLARDVTSITTEGATVSYEYYPNGKVYKTTDPDGQSKTYYYDNSWNCIMIRDGEGNSIRYTYDAEGNKTSETDPLGNKTTYQYDNHGRCTQVVDPNGNKTSYAYDANGNIIRVTDALGNVTRMTYDSLNQLVKTEKNTETGSVSVTYVYDESGQVVSVTDEDGHTCHIAYDGFGNEKTITDAEGNVVTSNTYDILGQLTFSTDALGNTTGYEYDTIGNIQKITECLNGINETGTAFDYDEGGRLLSVTDAAGTVSQTFDAKGNVASVTDVIGGTTTYSYDTMSRITEVINAIGAKESYTYNAAGLLAETKDNAGNKTTYTYDAAGRIIKQKDEEGTISYTYDKNGNVLTVSDKDGTITRTYDALNRVTSVTDYKGDTITYGYDQLGNRISVTYPGGEKVRYTYYNNGNLKTVTDARGNVTYYTYDKNGRLTETERGDGSRETRTYDAAGQLTGLKDETAAGEVINDYTYEYDGSGNITKITGMDAGISADLTGENAVTGADGTVTVSVSMTYDEDNRLLTYNGQTVEYDEVGNMTKGPLNGSMAEFTYDCRNRLIRVEEEDGTVTVYEYDAENIRTAVITNGIRTEYTTDRESTYSRVLIKTEYEKNFLGFYTEQRARTIYTYGIGLVSERRDDGEEYYYHYNHIGSTMAVSDEAGNVIYRFVYDTYGELSDIQTDDGISLKTAEAVQDATKDITLAELADATGIEYLYNGQYGVTTDRNGLYYMRARYYDQDIKRFINRDVVSGDITNSLSLNRYCYVQGNPVSLTDPFGLCPDGNSSTQGLAGTAFGNIMGMLNYLYQGLNIKDNISTYGHMALDFIGIVWDGADIINAVWYAAEGNYDMAVISAICALPFLGSVVGGSAGLAMKVIGYGLTFAMATEGTVEAVGRAADAYQEGNLSWWNALDVGINALGMGLAGRALGNSLGSALAGKTETGLISNAISRVKERVAASKGSVDTLGIVNEKTPASRFADKLRRLSNSKRPNTVAVVRTADGRYYAGYNKAGIYNENVQNILDSLGNSNEFNRQCAEINALSRAMNKGADLNGATISIANVRGKNNKSGLHGTYKEPCNVCQPLLDFLGIKDIH